ncbi:MAG: AMP-binding protein [Rhizobiaceae bacterium]
MLIAVVVLGLVVATVLAVAVLQMSRLGISFWQAVLYAPLKIIYRIDDTGISNARQTDAPVIYVISHQSRLEPALMLATLPADTLHILDEKSAAAMWLEPFRSLAPTIAFNAKHVFVSRRLVRRLRGKGRMAVYMPEGVEPDQRGFRLYRAVARIAVQADAKIVPVFINGSRQSPWSLVAREKAPRINFPRLRINALNGMTIADLQKSAGDNRLTNALALFDRLAEARVNAADPSLTIFEAMADAAIRFDPGRVVLEDPISGIMTYRRLMIAARVLGKRFSAIGEPGTAIGLLLPNANGVVSAFLGVQSSGRVAAMLNYTAGPAAIRSALKTARIETVVSSRAFIEKAELEPLVTAIEETGAKFIWLEDLREEVTNLEKLGAALSWNKPVVGRKAADPAIILFTSGSEGTPKGVVLSHRNIVTNALQAEARIDFSPADTLFNVLPVFHCFGLTGGTLLPLLTGLRLYLYPSPLHYKIIPKTAAKVRPTIMFGTDTFLAGYARTAGDNDFSSLRLIVAGAEPVRAETRRIWRERFGAEILEGFGMTEAAPVVAVNSATHGRDGTVGRLLPGMRMRVEPVEGIEDAGRLWLAGPNVMLGYLTADKPGELQPLNNGWHDSGDIVAIDREGFVAIRGRAKRFAKLAGEMVSLGAVELLAEDCWPGEHHAALAIPDKRKGERIILLTTHKNSTKAEIAKHAKSTGVAELTVPAELVHIEEIPVLGSGKTDYVAAQKMLLELLKKAA